MTKSPLALTLAALLSLAAVALAEEPAPPQNPLAGISTVYINAEPQMRMEIRRVLAKQLPQLKFPKKPSEAQVIFEVRTNLNPTRLDNRKSSEIVYRNIGTGTDIPATKRAIEQTGPRMVVNGLAGVAIRGNVVYVVHYGLSSPFFPTQFATEVVKAYKEANPAPETKP